MAVMTVDRIQHVKFWQVVLGIAGVLITGAAIAMQVTSSTYHQTTVASKTGDVTTTTTGPSAPPTALITACLSAGLLLVLIAAFFSRISKIVLPGGVALDLESQSALAATVAKKSGGDPVKAKKIYEKAAPVMAQRLHPPAAPVTVQALAAPPQLTDADVTKIVDDAAVGV